MELFHGPTFAFKDVALQLLGNLFEFFLVRRNQNKRGEDREHLMVIGATSGDTGSAAIFGLRGKKDISVFIMYPTGRISQMQEAQMTTVADKNGMFPVSQRYQRTFYLTDPRTSILSLADLSYSTLFERRWNV